MKNFFMMKDVINSKKKIEICMIPQEFRASTNQKLRQANRRKKPAKVEMRQFKMMAHKCK